MKIGTSKKGYKPAIEAIQGLSELSQEVATFAALREEVLATIDRLPDRRVTRQELLRDFGFSASGLRVLERWGVLVRDPNRSRRRTYSLRQALRAQLLFPGLANAPTVRTVRKKSNITTVVKDTFQRAIAS